MADPADLVRPLVRVRQIRAFTDEAPVIAALRPSKLGLTPRSLFGARRPAGVGCGFPGSSEKM